MSKITATETDWNTVFISKPCLPFAKKRKSFAGHQSGGRLDILDAEYLLPHRAFPQGYVSHGGVVDGKLVVEHQHLHALPLQGTYIEVQVSDLLVFEICHLQEFLRESLVQPSLSRGLTNGRSNLSQKSIEVDFRS